MAKKDRLEISVDRMVARAWFNSLDQDSRLTAAIQIEALVVHRLARNVDDALIIVRRETMKNEMPKNETIQ